MYVIASFKYSKHLETVISELKYIGVPNEKILALPLETRIERKRKLSSNPNLFEIAPIFGTIAALFGIIFGFILEWGPVLWGLIGLSGGLAAGFTLDILRKKKSDKKAQTERCTEVFLMIHCPKEQANKIKDILWDRRALGVTVFEG